MREFNRDGTAVENVWQFVKEEAAPDPVSLKEKEEKESSKRGNKVKDEICYCCWKRVCLCVKKWRGGSNYLGRASDRNGKKRTQMEIQVKNKKRESLEKNFNENGYRFMGYCRVFSATISQFNSSYL